MDKFHKTITLSMTMVTFAFLFMIVNSFYSNEISTKDIELNASKKQNDTLIAKIATIQAKYDSIANLEYKLVAGDSITRKGFKEYFRIYKRDVMIESSYDIDMKYINKIYKSATKVGVEPWLQLYYAHLENRVSPYSQKYPGRIERSNKDAYGIMQMTKIAVREVNNKLGYKRFDWEDVKYNTDINIEASSYYMKFYIMPVYEKFKPLDNVGNITFWFYNGGDSYGMAKVEWNGLSKYVR
jgi:hypothetical protein